MSLEDRLKQARIHSGKSQLIIAKAMGITDRTLKRYEKDALNLSVILAEKFADATDVDKIWLTYGVGDMKRRDSSKDGELGGQKSHQPDKCNPELGGDGVPSNGLPVVVQEHIDLIPRFQDKETAKAVNEKLIELEFLSNRTYKKIVNHINTVWETVTDTIEDYQSSHECQGGIALGRQKNGTTDL